MDNRLLTDEELHKLDRLPDEFGKVYAVAVAQLDKVDALDKEEAPEVKE